jgi:hypothetical protein
MTEAAGPRVTTERREATTAVPARRAVWRWAWSAARPYVGWALAALGGIALLLGWYGVSGEALTAKQLPYLVSGGLTGIALVILASVIIATDDVRRQLDRVDDLERKIDELHTLFAVELGTEPAGDGAATAPDQAALLALPSGTSYHRAGCTLVVGKSGADAVDPATIRRRGLRPCRVCDPPDQG